ncbi:peptidase [Flavobacterium covae]|uniref:BtrH N-terminal domain-containing protein n=1 Tax=Flavobacterium covae TaxID=2906076 RepID=A0ABW8PHA6_9FLAO|nr:MULTISPECIES: BtrH N-terminal domain-containing protein [Flavobacterium]MCJ1806699.1 BtrH N-terminal domain-containing protein [Flavobacterium covae]OWP81511.1 peptidase [Flavobacterium covae]OXA81532.1 peptidase [Flavobacterium columnare NBRC 100251 = ATCC 23463]POR22622.1 peptidase [Flavobacterium columnare]
MEIRFTHHQSAHCENGVASNLLKFNGINLSEPMVFGIGSGLFFFYFPLLKVNHAPAISYRPMPGSIFNKAARRLGIKVKRTRFSNPQKAQQALESNLKNNIPTGLQVGVYHLTYFPDEYRFHFNAHNLVVYGKENKSYLISDPVMQTVTTLSEKELEKVRFAKGALAPKGHMYYPVNIPKQVQLKPAIVKGIKNTCKDMLAPLPFIGIAAMRRLAKHIRIWPTKRGVKVTNHYLAQMVRMQEEIGTGGGGFRFIYAAFLQEASIILKNPYLAELSKEMTTIGDKWRDFAVMAARVYKNRSNQHDVYNTLANELEALAQLEENFFKKLKKAV